jgi:hypothetical protein
VKLGGLGLKNLIVVATFTLVFIVMMKVIFTKYPVKGVSEVVQSA